MAPTRILDGKAIAATVLAECLAEAADLINQGTIPGLAVVLVGDDPASKVYVGSKVRTCHELGFNSRKIELAEEFQQIGDDEGARELLREVLAQGEGEVKARAQALLDRLG